jgi:hypothetical protein
MTDSLHAEARQELAGEQKRAGEIAILASSLIPYERFVKVLAASLDFRRQERLHPE